MTGLEPAASDAEPIEPQGDTEAGGGDYNADDNTWLGKLVCKWPELPPSVCAKIVKLAGLD